MLRAALVLMLTAAPALAQFPPDHAWPEPPWPEEVISPWNTDRVLIPIPCLEPPAPGRHETLKAGPRQDSVVRWNEAALGGVRADRTPPPVAARNLALFHVAVYDAVNSVMRSHEPFLIRVVVDTPADAEAAAAAAAHRVLIALYPRQAAGFDAVLGDTLAVIPEGEAKARGIALGQSIAEKVLGMRRGDRPSTRSSYIVRDEPGRWRPTPPDYRPPLLPEWAGVRFFALRDATPFRPAGPPALTSPEFSTSLKEVRDLGGVASTLRTPDQTEIARFWADGEGTVTPAGHWNR